MSGELGDVPIHVRRVVAADGDFASENEVHCLLRSASIPVAECERCLGYAGSEIDLARHRNYILCRRLTPDAARAIEPARHVVLRRRVAPRPTGGEHTPVGEIMTRDVWCAREDLPVAALRRLLAERHIGSVPIVDGQGRPTGIVTATDLAQLADDGLPAREGMARLLFVLPDSASISQAAALMAIEHVHRILIVTDDGKLAGIISSLDVMSWLARQDGYVLPDTQR